MSPLVEQHEAAVARETGARHAIAFGHARHALVAILRASGVQGHVALAPLTCKVVPLAVYAAGLEPLWVDVHAQTMNLSADELARTQGASAVLVQHTYGSSSGVAQVVDLARSRNQLVVEDCAQCLPTHEAVPTLAALGPRHAAIFSNNLMKPMPAGSGGFAVTNDDTLAEGIRAVREELRAPGLLFSLSAAAQRKLHAALLWPRSYWRLYDLAQRVGSHYATRPLEEEIRREITNAPGRIGERQARWGVGGLFRVADLVDARRVACDDYVRALEGAEVKHPVVPEDAPLYYYPVLVPDKAKLLERAREERVEIVPWPLGTPIYPVEQTEALATYGYAVGSCPWSEWYAKYLVGLPTHSRTTAASRAAAVRLVIENVNGSADEAA